VHHLGLVPPGVISRSVVTFVSPKWDQYIHSPSCAAVTFRKVRRKLDFAQVGIACKYGRPYLYIPGSPV